MGWGECEIIGLLNCINGVWGCVKGGMILNIVVLGIGDGGLIGYMFGLWWLICMVNGVGLRWCLRCICKN